MENKSSNKAIILWLAIICFMVFAMVVIGGITRLTNSGLSMVEWRPLMGILPPLNDIEWNRVFDLYRKYPEYQLINHGMSLSEFKQIFFWEYFHRLMGRSVGLVFFFPWLYFLLRKKLSKALNLKLLVAFTLGGLQGLMGWYMVKSGLVKHPDVSHLRLAAHLLLAFIIIGYVFWIILELLPLKLEETQRKISSLRNLSFFILVLTIIQIVYGAFTAGLNAGMGYNTFPMMNNEWFPSLALSLEPFWLNFINNTAMLQFIHRSIAWVLVIFTVILFFSSRKFSLNRFQKISLIHLVSMMALQFILGVFTLIKFVPTGLAVMHQAGACLLMLFSIASWYSFKENGKT